MKNSRLIFALVVATAFALGAYAAVSGRSSTVKAVNECCPDGGCCAVSSCCSH
jgi:hypothetical protein